MLTLDNEPDMMCYMRIYSSGKGETQVNSINTVSFVLYINRVEKINGVAQSDSGKDGEKQMYYKSTWKINLEILGN